MLLIDHRGSIGAVLAEVGDGINVIVEIDFGRGGLVLSVRDIFLLVVTWDVLGRQLTRILILGWIILSLLDLLLRRRELGLRLGRHRGGWLLVVLAEVLPNIVVDLAGSGVRRPELGLRDASEVPIFLAEVLDEVEEYLHAHLELFTPLLLRRRKPRRVLFPHVRELVGA